MSVRDVPRRAPSRLKLQLCEGGAVVMGRRGALVLCASALLGACAIKPPPTNGAPDDSPTAGGTSSSPSPESNVPSSPTAGSSSPATTAPDASPEAVPVVGIVGINHNTAAAAYAVPAATVHTWLTTKTGPATKTAFLTFDDGPSVITPQVLDALKQLGVPATFFVIGRYLELNPAITQRAMAEGHAICLHSYSHDYTYLYPGRVGNVVNIAADYDKALAVATRVLGPTYAPGGYRYPGGHMSWTGLEAADAALTQRNVSWIDWNCMSGDADRTPPANPDQAIANLTSTFTASGSPSAAVLLNHDSHGAHVTLATLPRFVQFFRDRGYAFGVIG
jgi:peptidoglycan/xylan/chitin deacetylase (PgdA/CDA1 family)